MSRLTISIDYALHKALKQTAARQGRSMGKIIEEGLILRGIKPVSTSRDLVAKARARAQKSEIQAIQLAIEEVRAERTR